MNIYLDELCNLVKDGSVLTVRQLSLLIEIYKNPCQSVDFYQEKLNLNKPSITRSAKALIELGYIRKYRNPLDFRKISVFLSMSGIDLIAKLLKIDENDEHFIEYKTQMKIKNDNRDERENDAIAM